MHSSFTTDTQVLLKFPPKHWVDMKKLLAPQKFYMKKTKTMRGQQESNQRPQDLQSYALPLSYDPDSMRVEGPPCSAKGAVQNLSHSTLARQFSNGALAQSEECVLCKHEVRGSKPRCSINFFAFWFVTSCFLIFFSVTKKAGSMGELNPRPLAP